MNPKEYQLIPFTEDNDFNNWQVTANIDYRYPQLKIHYQIKGDLTQLKIPAVVSQPQRVDGLWENTCLEFFLGIVDSPLYWEFNLSPSGNWNVYSFNGYRQEMKPEQSFASLPFQFNRQPDYLSLEVMVDLTKIISSEQPVEFSLTTVIQDIHENISYWAMEHVGSEADFHLRKSFTALS